VRRTDWQNLIAIGLAAACGAWAAWSVIRPFVRRDARCGECGSIPPDLLQIEPADPPPHPRSDES